MDTSHDHSISTAHVSVEDGSRGVSANFYCSEEFATWMPRIDLVGFQVC